MRSEELLTFCSGRFYYSLKITKMIYFKLQLDQQQMSDLTYIIPEKDLLLINRSQTSEEFYGVIQENWYNEMIKNLPRQTLDSLEVINFSEFHHYVNVTKEHAEQRRYVGNSALM